MMNGYEMLKVSEKNLEAVKSLFLSVLCLTHEIYGMFPFICFRRVMIYKKIKKSGRAFPSAKVNC